MIKQLSERFFHVFIVVRSLKDMTVCICHIIDYLTFSMVEFFQLIMRH